MDDESLMRQLEATETPVPTAPAHQQHLKLTLLSATRSSRIGVLMVGLPCIFIFGIFLKYQLRWHVGWLTAVEEWMSRMDHTLLWFVVPLLLVGAPLLALALNLLALMHVKLDRTRRELQITLRLKIASLLVCLVSVIILAAVFIHVIGERG